MRALGRLGLSLHVDQVGWAVTPCGWGVEGGELAARVGTGLAQEAHHRGNHPSLGTRGVEVRKEEDREAAIVWPWVWRLPWWRLGCGGPRGCAEPASCLTTLAPQPLGRL